MATSPLDELLEKLARTISEIRRIQARLGQSQGISQLQYSAIHALRSAGSLSIGELAAHLHLNQSTVSGLADRLERDGLARRVQSSRDRRSVRLRLTERADEIAERADTPPSESLKNLVASALSREEQAILAKLVSKLEAALSARIAELDARRDDAP